MPSNCNSYNNSTVETIALRLTVFTAHRLVLTYICLQARHPGNTLSGTSGYNLHDNNACSFPLYVDIIHNSYPNEHKSFEIFRPLKIF